MSLLLRYLPGINSLIRRLNIKPLTTEQGMVIKKVFVSIFTQGLLSIISFAIGMLMVRYSTKKDYAIFAISFSIISIMGSVQNALANAPLTVLYAKKEESEQRAFVSGMAFGQLLYFFPLITVILISFSIYSLLANSFSLMAKVTLLIFAILTYLGKEYIRTIHYINLKISKVLLMDIAFMFSACISIFAFFFSQGALSYNTALMSLFGGYSISLIFGYALLANKFQYSWPSAKRAIKETWNYAFWAFIGTLSSVVETQAYIFVVSFFLSLEATADISAARLLMMPAGLILASSIKIIMAKGSELLGRSSHANFARFIHFMTLFLFIVSITYTLVLFAFYGKISSILGEKYQNIKTLTILWAILFLFQGLKIPIKNALIVYKEFKAVTINDIISGGCTLLVCLLFTKFMGVKGALFSLILGELLLLFLSSRLWIRRLRTEKHD